jgi:lipopolysaccharide biosynthesis protein
VFISSWNNWAEGGHLEPDRRFGYGYLHATANVLRCYHRDAVTEKLIEEVNASFSRTSDVAIIFHCYYEDLIDPIFERYLAGAKGVDLFVTLRLDISGDAIAKIRERSPNVYFLRNENRGRDMRPFLLALRHVESLGYRFACKVHTKKTPQAESGAGELWRQRLLERLLGAADSSAQAVRLFNEEPDLGLLVPEGSVMDLRELRNHIDNTFWLDRLLASVDKDMIGNYNFSFPAGSMYWFRMEALEGLESLVFPEDAFEPELGQRDGTLAHAMERLVALYTLRRGFHMKEINVTEGVTATANPVIGRSSSRTLAPLS